MDGNCESDSLLCKVGCTTNLLAGLGRGSCYSCWFHMRSFGSPLEMGSWMCSCGCVPRSWWCLRWAGRPVPGTRAGSCCRSATVGRWRGCSRRYCCSAGAASRGARETSRRGRTAAGPDPLQLCLGELWTKGLLEMQGFFYHFLGFDFVIPRVADEQMESGCRSHIDTRNISKLKSALLSFNMPSYCVRSPVPSQFFLTLPFLWGRSINSTCIS